jgi:hypothetical protein
VRSSYTRKTLAGVVTPLIVTVIFCYSVLSLSLSFWSAVFLLLWSLVAAVFFGPPYWHCVGITLALCVVSGIANHKRIQRTVGHKQTRP